MDKIRIRVVVLLITLFTIHAQFEYTKAISIDDYFSYIDDSQCTDKLGITLNEVLNIPSNQSDISTRLKCFAACMMEYAGLMRGCLVEDDDSNYNFIEGIPKEWVLESVEECSGNIADLYDQCECAFEMSNCIAGRLPEKYIPQK